MAWMITAVFITIFALFVFCLQCGMIRTAWRMVEYTPPLNARDPGTDPRARTVSFATSDGLTLKGALFFPEDQEPLGLVVFCHEFGGSRWSSMYYAQALLDAGFAILGFDFRSHGDSDSLDRYQPFHWVTAYEIDDLCSALRFVESQTDLNQLPLGLFGVSRGGGTALTVAGQTDSIRAVVCESAYSSRKMMDVFADRWQTLFAPEWAMNRLPRAHSRFTIACARLIASFRRGCRFVHVEQSLPALRDRPVLLISGKRDNYVCPEIAEHLRNSINSDLTTLWLVPRARHNQSRETSTQEFDRRIVALFRRMVPDRQVTESRSEEPAADTGLAGSVPEVSDSSLASH